MNILILNECQIDSKLSIPLAKTIMKSGKFLEEIQFNLNWSSWPWFRVMKFLNSKIHLFHKLKNYKIITDLEEQGVRNLKKLRRCHSLRKLHITEYVYSFHDESKYELIKKELALSYKELIHLSNLLNIMINFTENYR